MLLFLQSTTRLEFSVSEASQVEAACAGWVDNSLASCQNKKKRLMLSEASEFRQDPRRTSHLSWPKHFMLNEASELRQDPRHTSHLSRPKHLILSEAVDNRSKPGA